ncbi:MAG: nicotinate (nicotinamide) nucleotide adenylyltransferase [Nitrospira sp.]|nr:nicotinate (nicotinamide) nucleotide adenylyltransferase [Nitrospira sp.]
MNVSNPQHSALNAQSSSPQRLGLLGGSFNPIHNGHLTIAHQVYERLQLTRVLFIPTGDPPHKQSGSLAPAQTRLKMVELAIAETPGFEVSALELHRVGKSYSIDTVREVQSQYGPSWNLFFIIGLDAFLEFSTWRAPEQLLRLCHFVVVTRPRQSFQSLSKMPLLSNLDAQALRQLDLGTLDQMELAVPDSSGLTCLTLPPCLISASEIRRRVQCGLPLANMLPPPVESYILQHSLYQEDRNRTHI